MRISPHILATPLHLFYRLWCSSLRFHEENRETIDALNAQGERLIFCLWHDELFPLMRMQKQLRIVTLVSASRDGEWLAVLLEKLGLRTVRGSSSRGGANALLAAARMMKKDHIHACITVDGPRGPRHKAKEGAIMLGHQAEAYISPVRIIMQPSLRVASWDRFQIPLPFAKVRVIHGQPWLVQSEDMTKQALAEGCQRLEQELTGLYPDKSST